MITAKNKPTWKLFGHYFNDTTRVLPREKKTRKSLRVFKTTAFGQRELYMNILVHLLLTHERPSSNLSLSLTLSLSHTHTHTHTQNTHTTLCLSLTCQLNKEKYFRSLLHYLFSLFLSYSLFHLHALAHTRNMSLADSDQGPLQHEAVTLRLRPFH